MHWNRRSANAFDFRAGCRSLLSGVNHRPTPCAALRERPRGSFLRGPLLAMTPLAANTTLRRTGCSLQRAVQLATGLLDLLRDCQHSPAQLWRVGDPVASTVAQHEHAVTRPHAKVFLDQQHIDPHLQPMGVVDFGGLTFCPRR